MEYKELVKSLSDAAWKYGNYGTENGGLLQEAADAIEELEFDCNRYEKDYKDLCAYLPKKWISAEEKLPEEPGTYLVCVHEPLEKEGCLAEYNMSYVDLLLYDAEQGVWQNGQYDAYNAHLEFVDKKHAYFISHWQGKPALPKEVS